MGTVGILSRLKQTETSKRNYSALARSLGFEEFIRFKEEERINITSHLENVFEAFIGCTEYLIDSKIYELTGYCIIYTIIKKIMDTVDISSYRNGAFIMEKLYDAKSQLNNIWGTEFKKLINIEYDINKTEDSLGSEGDHKYRLSGRAIVKLNYQKINNVLRDAALSSEKSQNLNNLIKNLHPSYQVPSLSYGANKKIAGQKAAEALLKSGILDNLRRQMQPIITLVPTVGATNESNNWN
jgi:dsRNA-specific ribonuclease